MRLLCPMELLMLDGLLRRCMQTDFNMSQEQGVPPVEWCAP